MGGSGMEPQRIWVLGELGVLGGGEIPGNLGSGGWNSRELGGSGGGKSSENWGSGVWNPWELGVLGGKRESPGNWGPRGIGGSLKFGFWGNWGARELGSRRNWGSGREKGTPRELGVPGRVGTPRELGSWGIGGPVSGGEPEFWGSGLTGARAPGVTQKSANRGEEAHREGHGAGKELGGPAVKWGGVPRSPWAGGGRAPGGNRRRGR